MQSHQSSYTLTLAVLILNQKEQNGQPTATAYFAVLMGTLRDIPAEQTDEVKILRAVTLHLLSKALPRSVSVSPRVINDSQSSFGCH